jgi:hypothetical protein
MTLFLEMAGSARPTKFNPVLDFSPRGRSGDHFHSKELTIYFIFSAYKTVAKVLWGEGEQPFIASSLGEHKVRPYVKNIHLIEKWYYHKSPDHRSRDFRRGLNFLISQGYLLDSTLRL